MRYLYSLQSFAQSLSWKARYLMYIGTAAIGCIAVISIYPRIWWIVLLGVAVIALLLLLFRLMLVMRDRKRGKETNAKVLSGSQGRGGVTDAQDQAALDDLQKKFSNGVETLDSLGLDLYALPWFVIVGQPASGKTEAIRRCRIPFPPGLTDELQGTGGTVNMDWWFTNDAVILDTAGKMLFQEAGQGTSPEWVKFLKLVREARPHCPINGMLLVIPADSLISDSPEQIDQNAKTIATQLNLIQRTLGVRFPVFVLITKCDLVTGFREFFDSLDDRRHQQMLGWSNPDPLDTAFDPSKIEAHLTLVRQRLEQRRFDLLQDPVSTQGKSERRLDEVDRLYDFPAAMEGLSDKLQSYLEIIFTGSKLAPKPLFLRGIYFTSSIQKGSILDGVLAEAMGVPLDSLTETRPFERVRPLFLRDLFMEKIFPEGGLVTRADNTVKLKSRRRALVLGTAAIGTILLIGVSWLGFRTFQKSIGDQGEVWTGIAGTIESDQPPSLLMETSPGMADYLYDGDRDPIRRDGERPMDQLPGITHTLAEQRIKVPFIFRLTSGLDGDLLRNERRDAHRNLLGTWMMRPVVGATTDRLEKTTDRNDPQAVAALAQLIRLRTLRAGQTPSGPPATYPADADTPRDSAANLHTLLHFNITGENLANLSDRADQLQQLQHVIDDTLAEPEDRQAFARQALEGQVTDDQLNHFLAGYLGALDAQAASQDGPVAELSQLAGNLRALKTAEWHLHDIENVIATGQPQPPLEHWHAWSVGEDGFADNSDAAVRQYEALKSRGYDMTGEIDQLIQRAVQDEVELARDRLGLLLDQLPSRTAAASSAPSGAAEPAQTAAALAASADRDPQLERLQDRIEQWLTAYEAKLNSRFVTDQTDFAELRSRYLTPTEAMRRTNPTDPGHPCVLLSAMYQTTDTFTLSPPEGLTLTGLAPAIADVDRAVQQVLAGFNPTSNILRDNAPASHCALILNYRCKSVRSALLELATSDDVSTLAIADAVARLAPDPEDQGAWVQPDIPMSAGFSLGSDEESFYEDRYHPEGLKAYLGGLGAVLTLAKTPDFDNQFASPDEDRERLASASVQLRAYLESYADYWTRQVVSDADYRSTDDWDTFLAAIRLVDAGTVQRGLDRLADQIESAIDAIPADLLDADTAADYTSRVERVVNALTASRAQRAGYVDAADALLEHWRRVGDLKAEARVIRRMLPSEFPSAYLKGLYPEGRTADAPVAFWKDFTYNALQLVAAEGGREIDQARARLNDPDDLMRFPLFNRPGRGDDEVLSVEELTQARATIQTLTARTSNSAGSDNTIGAGNNVAGYDDINQLLAQMRGGNRIDEAEQLRLERLAQIIDALTHRGGLEVEVWIPGEDFLKDHVPPGVGDMAPANRRFTHVDVPGSQRDLSTQAGANQQAFTLSIPSGDTFELGFSYEGGAGVAANRVPYTRTGRWSAIDAILPAGDEDDIYIDGDGVYWVPIQVRERNANQTPRYYWIGMKFERPLPSPTDWPTGEAP